MKRIRAATLSLVLCAIAWPAAPASAAFHLMKISEVFPGSALHPNAQYVELQMFANGQNQVSGHSVILFDAANTMVGTFTFSGAVATGTNQSTILIATAEAAALFNLTSNLTMTPMLSARGGKVCFDTIDCVSWGNYSGTNTAVGTPFNASGGITLGRAIHRDLAIAGGATTLESGDDTGDSANDFDLGLPSPRTNAGVTGTVPASTCGNTTTEGLESCDDGNGTDSDACKNDCTYGVICGDTIVSAGEECDDGNSTNTDACKNDCSAPECGDTVVSTGEECDDGNDTNTDACKDDCTDPECGDGVVTAPEACDDNNMVNVDACKNDCSLPMCGDGVISQGEPCDDGNMADDDGCSNSCVLRDCGNMADDPGEQCDDGNNVPGDGCAASCVLEFCGDGVINDSGAETCDDQNSVDTDACRNDCSLPACGDTLVSTGEDCDDGNAIDTDACRNDCTAPVCGDGITDDGEDCDDDNAVDDDACHNDCTAPVCGDGTMDAGEECDDANRDNTDECRNDCTSAPVVVAPACGDGVTDSGEECDDDNVVDGDGCDHNCMTENETEPMPTADSGCSCHAIGVPHTHDRHDSTPTWPLILLSAAAIGILLRRASTNRTKE